MPSDFEKFISLVHQESAARWVKEELMVWKCFDIVWRTRLKG